MSSAPRILLIQLKRIGDVILTTPALSALREAFPTAHLTLAIDVNANGLAAALPADEVLVRRAGVAGLSFWSAIFRGKFSTALDFTGNDRSALVTALSRAPQRITYARFARKPLRRLIFTEFVDSSVRHRHTADHHTDLLQPLGIQREDVSSALALPPSAIAEADTTLLAAGLTAPYAIVHPGTARAEKYWLPERWAAVIDFLQTEKQLTVFLTGSNDASEQSHFAAIKSHLAQPAVDVSGKLSLLGTAALIARARLVAAVDSAPVHFADALGTPVVALFGPTNPFHWRPRNSQSVIVSPNEIVAATAKGTPMTSLNTSQVLTALSQL